MFSSLAAIVSKSNLMAIVVYVYCLDDTLRQ